MTDTPTIDDVITTRVVAGVRWFYVQHPKRPKVRAATPSYERAVDYAVEWYGLERPREGHHAGG
jgi:hypothetical protein